MIRKTALGYRRNDAGRQLLIIPDVARITRTKGELGFCREATEQDCTLAAAATTMIPPGQCPNDGHIAD